MAYQIPSNTKALFLLEETKINMYTILPQQDLLFKHITVTMFIKGHLATDFKMRINVYADTKNGKLLIASNPINNLDITRTTDLYTELRFDFEKLGNTMSLQKYHMVEFEIYDGYTYDTNNYVAIIYDYYAAQNFLGSDQYILDINPSSFVELCAKCSFFFDTPNASTEKYMLARITGSKLFNGLTGLERTEYQFFPSRQFYTATIQKGLRIDGGTGGEVYPRHIHENFGTKTTTNVYPVDAAFTPDPLNLATNLNRYHYNPVTGEICFYIEAILSEVDWFILDYSLFFTDGRGKYADANPGVLDPVYHQPRLLDGTSFEFSQQNILQGILSISSSPLNLKNHDGYFNDFLSPNDTFSNRPVQVWRYDSKTQERKTQFVGVVRGIEVDDEQCTFSLADNLVKLDNVYDDYLPLNALELAQLGAYYIRTVDIDKPVPRVLGKISSFGMLTKYTGQAFDIQWYGGEKLISCTNVLFNNVPSTSVNRTWSCGFGPASAATQQRDVTAVANYTSGTFLGSKFTIDNTLGPISEWLPAGTHFVNNGQYGIVYDSNDTEAYVWPRNASFSAAADIIRHKVTSVVVLRDNVPWYAMPGRDYTCQIGAAGDLQIVFTNNFEANLWGAGYLNPFEDEVYCVFMNDDTDAKASTIIQNLLSLAYISTNVSFAPDQTNPWVDAELALTIPAPGSSSMPTYRELVELCLKSALGFLYFGNSGLIQYKSFLHEIEADIDDVVNQSGFDASDAIKQSNSRGFSAKVDLWDLFGGVYFDFTHCKRYSSYKFEYAMVKDFYQTENLYMVETVIDPTRKATYDYLDEYTKLVMGRQATVTLDVLSDHINLFVGDDIQVARKKIMGGENTSTLRVVSIAHQPHKATIGLMDLKKFPSL